MKLSEEMKQDLKNINDYNLDAAFSGKEVQDIIQDYLFKVIELEKGAKNE